MKSGVWHQFGDRSQKIILEQLEYGLGSGIILSPRDLNLKLTRDYTVQYSEFDVDLIIDQQFYEPNFSNDNLKSYPIENFRVSTDKLNTKLESNWKEFSEGLEKINKDANATALLAPGLVYEVGRSDIVNMNNALFENSKIVGDSLGIPTYQTVFLGKSVTSSQSSINEILSIISEINSDGIYFGFEFENERVPYRKEYIFRFLNTLLNIHLTEQPTIHAYAGPMSILSMAAGANGAGIGHFQNTWHFKRERWIDTGNSGGSGNAPPRFFSKNLWGTIVYPDETADLPPTIRNAVINESQSPFSVPTKNDLVWKRWDSNKHLLFILGTAIKELDELTGLENKIDFTSKLLSNSVTLGNKIEDYIPEIKDDSNIYQANWLDCIKEFKRIRSDDLFLSSIL